jgi:hypothetical protein
MKKNLFFVLIVFFLYIILSMQIIQNKPKKKNSPFYPNQIPQSSSLPVEKKDTDFSALHVCLRDL